MPSCQEPSEMAPRARPTLARSSCARAIQLPARASSPCSARPARPMPAASIQLWFCGYSSTYQAFGQYWYMRSASVRGGQDGIEQVIGAGDSDQESADVQVGPAEVRDLAEPPVAPAQVSLEAQLRLRCVLRVSGQLVAEGPGAHVLPEEARVVVIGGLGRGVV